MTRVKNPRDALENIEGVFLSIGVAASLNKKLFK
jgi:hypothetical protein